VKHRKKEGRKSFSQGGDPKNQNQMEEPNRGKTTAMGEGRKGRMSEKVWTQKLYLAKQRALKKEGPPGGRVYIYKNFPTFLHFGVVQPAKPQICKGEGHDELRGKQHGLHDLGEKELPRKT